MEFSVTVPSASKKPANQAFDVFIIAVGVLGRMLRVRHTRCSCRILVECRI